MKTFNSKHTHQYYTVFAVCALLASFDNPVLALEKGVSDIKYYPAASLCYSPEQASFDHSWRMQFNPDGSVENPSKTRQLEIVCPITRDNTLSRGDITVKVRYEIYDNKGDLKCRLAGRSLDGKTQFMPDYQTRNISGHSTFHFRERDSLDISLLQCTLPKIYSLGIEGEGSRINSIKVLENP